MKAWMRWMLGDRVPGLAAIVAAMLREMATHERQRGAG